MAMALTAQAAILGNSTRAMRLTKRMVVPVLHVMREFGLPLVSILCLLTQMITWMRIMLRK